MVVLPGSERLSSTPALCPLHPSRRPLTPATELPPPRCPWRFSPPIPHRRRRAKSGTGGGGVRAPLLAVGFDPDGWN